MNMQLKSQFFKLIDPLARNLHERSNAEVNERLQREDEDGIERFQVPKDYPSRISNIIKGNALERLLDDVGKLLGKCSRHPILPSGKIPDSIIEANRKQVYVECKNHRTDYLRDSEFWEREDRFEGVRTSALKVVVAPRLGEAEKRFLWEKNRARSLLIGKQVIPSLSLEEVKEIYWKVFLGLGRILYGLRGVFTLLSSLIPFTIARPTTDYVIVSMPENRNTVPVITDQNNGHFHSHNQVNGWVLTRRATLSRSDLERG